MVDVPSSLISSTGPSGSPAGGEASISTSSFGIVLHTSPTAATTTSSCGCSGYSCGSGVDQGGAPLPSREATLAPARGRRGTCSCRGTWSSPQCPLLLWLSPGCLRAGGQLLDSFIVPRGIIVFTQSDCPGQHTLQLIHQLTVEEQEWIGRELFKPDSEGRTKLTTDLKLWWDPPQPRPSYTQPPASPAAFFACRLFLWTPVRLWGIRLTCCNKGLTKCGLYKTIRRVLDIDGWYLMATEYLECRRCKKKVAAWSQEVVSHLQVSSCLNTESHSLIIAYVFQIYTHTRTSHENKSVRKGS
nr:uncharacterized protein LOC129447527 [Misgurnus anguillicaudatus]